MFQSNGLKLDPWGQPIFISFHSLTAVPNLVLPLRSSKNERISDTAPSEKP